MKPVRILLSLSLASLLLFLAGQAFALQANTTTQPKNTPGAVATQKAEEKEQYPKGKRENLKGIVEAINPSNLTLILRDGSTANIGLNADTRIKVPGMKGATLDYIQPGMQALVQAVRDQGGSLVALRLMVKPDKPTKVHRVGWVTEYTPGASITIQAHDGNLYTFALTDETKILPEERAGELTLGSRVTIIAPRNPATPQGTANGIVVHPEGSGADSQPAAP